MCHISSRISVGRRGNGWNARASAISCWLLIVADEKLTGGFDDGFSQLHFNGFLATDFEVVGVIMKMYEVVVSIIRRRIVRLSIFYLSIKAVHRPLPVR